MAKYGGAMAEPGAVKWQFEEKGELWISGKKRTETKNGKTIEHLDALDIGQLEEDILETNAQNYEIDEESVRVITSRDDFVEVKRFLEEK